jgi:cell division ATPase FtsA
MIPVGNDEITENIAKVFNLSKNEAEEYKLKKAE